MSGATIFDLPTVPRLQTLLQNVADGTILVPRFQRPFVWSDEQRFLLLDSVLKGLPIGSLMVWRTTEHRLRCYEDLPPFHLTVPPEDKRSGVQTYLLDGMQRLTTLYGALKAPSDEAPPADEEGHTRWPIYLDLSEKKQDPFRIASRRTGWRRPDTWLPLSILFDPTAVWDFQQELLRKLQASGRGRELVRKVEQIATRFKDYTVPVIPIHTDDLDLATESFQRVNSGGARLEERHMLVALTFGRKWDVNEGLDSVGQRLESLEWAGLDDAILLDALKSYFNLEPQKRAVTELRDALQKEPGVFDKLAPAAERAVRFLIDRCGIDGPLALPFSYQLVSLIDLCMREVDLDAHAEALERWVRATAYSGYFASMNSTQLQRALQHARDLVDEGREVPPLPDDLDRRVGPVTRFNYNAARTRAFVWTLVESGPLDADGRPIPARRAVGQRGNDALDVIVPGASGTEPANRIVVADADVRSLRKALRDPQGVLQSAICRSHFVDPESARALREGRHDAFFELRARAIWRKEAEHLAACGLTPVSPP